MIRSVLAYSRPLSRCVVGAVLRCDNHENQTSGSSESILYVDDGKVCLGFVGGDDTTTCTLIEFDNGVTVLRAVWVAFDATSNRSSTLWLAVLTDNGCLILRAPSGTEITIALPRPTNAMWPLALPLSDGESTAPILHCGRLPKQGIILQQETNGSGSWMVCRSGNTGLWSLTSPLDGMRPVNVADSSARCGDENACRRQSILNDHLVYVSDFEPAWIVSHTGTEHRLWHVLPSECKKPWIPSSSSASLWLRPTLSIARRIPPSGNVHLQSTTPARRAFYVVNESGAPLLCMLLTSGKLITVSSSAQVSFVASNCRDALPVATSKHALDMVILKDDGLHLHRGSIRIMKAGNAVIRTYLLTAAQNPPRPECASHAVIDALTDPCGSRISVMCGQVVYRLEITLQTRDEATNDALHALEVSLPPQQALALRAATLQASLLCCDDWTAFTLVLDAVLAVSAVGVVSTSPVDMTASLHKSSSECCAWEQLLQSSFHNMGVPHSDLKAILKVDCRSWVQRYVEHSSANTAIVAEIQQALMYCYDETSEPLSAETIIRSLHLIYEDAKVCPLTWNRVTRYGLLLQRMCQACAFPDIHLYVSRYCRDVSPQSDAVCSKELGSLAADVCEWLSMTYVAGAPPYSLEVLPDALPNGACAPGIWTRRLAQIFRALDVERSPDAGVAQTLVLAMTHAGLNRECLSLLSPGIALPFYDAIDCCRLQPPSVWPAETYDLIGRSDLAQMVRQQRKVRTSSVLLQPCLNGRDRLPTKGSQSSSTLGSILRHAQPSRATNEDNRADHANSMEVQPATMYTPRLTYPRCFGNSYMRNRHAACEQQDDGLPTCEQGCMLRFGDDWRITEACRLLKSSAPAMLRITRTTEMSDLEFEKLKHAKLLLECVRSCTAPLGRAMLTLGTYRQRASAVEALPIPRLCMSGYSFPGRVTVSLDTASAALFTVWSFFHNGVAAGLRLCNRCDTIDCKRELSRQSSKQVIVDTQVTRAWIVYNRPKIPSAQHGGVLLALGLQFHLNVLTMTDLFEYLTHSHEATTIGLLLGMAASRRGTANSSVSKMFCLHIPALLPHPFADIEVSCVSQVAAIAGIGLVYERTANLLMTEFLLSEIHRSSPRHGVEEREAYSLSAGLAFGMVTLGMGRRPVASDAGRPAAPDPFSDSCGCKHGCVTGGVSLLRLPLEGDHWRGDAASAGAIMAIGFYFMASNSHAVANRLQLPDTRVLLDSVRPDLLLLRLFARSLVLWDLVKPTFSWVEEQLPRAVAVDFACVRDRSSNNTATKSPEDEIETQTPPDITIRQAHANAVAGGCLAIGMRYAGTASSLAAITLRHYLTHFIVLVESYGASRRASVASITTLSITSLHAAQRTSDACEFAVYKARTSSYDAEAAYTAAAATEAALGSCHETNLQTNLCPRAVAAIPTINGTACIIRPDRSTVESCLGTTAVALSIVMAGTGDIACLRLLRAIRHRLDDDTTYGFHMAISMAIGLLFMGCGRASLSRNKESIAALVCAFFPRFPRSPSDNQYHLQALRHLWTLSVSWRSIDVVDADTGEIMSVPIQISLKPSADWKRTSNLCLRLRAPCLAPPFHDICQITLSASQ
mmetsp:Transcript_19803/g.78869  ORF Transcript_19803/g.78869 Transcript_19803/m.78869 type:complete len:1598 (+) Transcript_19803:94-4887(+)